MTYAIEEIARTLRGAREAKGLSQRALSAKAGLTQTHISKIENAAVDIQLSNLMELARALDLEVMLVPRKAVPAAQGLIRNIETTMSVPVEPGKAVRRLGHTVEKLATLFPTKETDRLQKLAFAFQHFRLNKEQVQTITDAAREFQRISESWQKVKRPNLSVPTAELKRIDQITNQLREMRNAIVHAVPSTNINRVLPAYRLDEGESDG